MEELILASLEAHQVAKIVYRHQYNPLGRNAVHYLISSNFTIRYYEIERQKQQVMGILHFGLLELAINYPIYPMCDDALASITSNVSLRCNFFSGEYQQNLCVDTDPSCAKCETKFPSCKGLTDGPHFFPGKEWERDYIFCFKNRTTQTKKCPPTQYFNPRLNKCTDVVETGN